MVENAALRALRLMDLVPYISSRPGVSIRELSEEFSVTKEEILKDLNLLFLCGLPGYTPLELIDLSFDDGTVVVRDPQNLDAPRNLTESEALALRIAVAALEELIPHSHSSYQTLISLRQKLARAFSSEIPDKAISFVADKEKLILSTIQRALDSKSDLEIEYLNQTKDEVALRRITPLHIEVDGDRTLVHAQCHTAQGVRTFNLQRISSTLIVENESTRVIYEENENLGIEVELSISEEGGMFWESNKSSLRKTSEGTSGPGNYILKVFQPEWMIRTAIVDSLRINAPEILRAAIMERCTTALENYAMVS